MLNKGYLTCDRTSKGDECMTPFYAVDPLLEFIPKGKTVWCPFDEEWSAFVQVLSGGVQSYLQSLKKRRGFLRV